MEGTANEREITDLLGVNNCILFNSRNIIERSTGLCKVHSRIPLSKLLLYRINPDLFVGIIFLTELFYHVTLLPAPLFSMTDEAGNIQVISDSLCSFLGIQEPMNALGKREEEYIKKDHHKFTSTEKASPALHETSLESVNFRGETVFYKYNGDLPDWPSEFKVEITFHSNDNSMPNMLLWASEWEEGDLHDGYHPDGKGIHFSRIRSGKQYRYFIKENGKLLHYVNSNEYLQGTPIKVSIEMQNGNIIFTENDFRIGVWEIPSWAFQNAGKRLYLFLRSNEQAKLQNIKIGYREMDSGKWKGRTSVETGRAKVGTTEYSLLYSSAMEVVSGNIFTLHLFNDITELHRAISADESEIIRNIKKDAEAVAVSDLSVLIEGETGTGKEVLARAIHDLSKRKDGPFIKVDCSVLPENMVESELFGHMKGAFTGAISDYTGKLEQAQNGTLFIDEISNLSLRTQAKLLGFLQDYKFQRVGGTKTISLDIRIICAANIPLEDLIKSGKFRDDLYYRVNQYRFALPPLRKRKENIPEFAEQFIREANTKYNRFVQGITPEAYRKIFAYDWPGNIRELKNTVMRGVLFCKSAHIKPVDISFGSASANTEFKDTTNSLSKIKRKSRSSLKIPKEKVENLYRQHNRNITEIARTLDLSRPSVYKLLREYSIS
jgi:transcriptional regulator with AAA-type ATPase domain